jgi:hypothetical protein
MKDGKLKTPLLVTTGEGSYSWHEYYGLARTDAELRDYVESIMDGGQGTTDVSFWERVELPEKGEPPRGSYIVATSYTSDGEPFDVHNGEVACKETIHQLRERALEDMNKIDEWTVTVWREVEVDIETEVKVKAIFTSRPHGKKKARRKRLA